MKKVIELTGAELALWVARANKTETPGNRPLYESGGCLYVESYYGGGEPFQYRPDNWWEHGGPIIEREKINLKYNSHMAEFGQQWVARIDSSRHNLSPRYTYGKTPLIAAMRAYVASVYGECVDE